jgi:hypothetical protein
MSYLRRVLPFGFGCRVGVVALKPVLLTLWQAAQALRAYSAQSTHDTTNR